MRTEFFYFGENEFGFALWDFDGVLLAYATGQDFPHFTVDTSLPWNAERFYQTFVMARNLTTHIVARREVWM